MKISVVIPVHNEEKYIKQCIQSLLDQIEKPYEIIVVNNDSTDNTQEILEQFKEIKILNEHKRGIIEARDFGFNFASGDIIARCDADTICPKDWILKIKENLSEKEFVAVSGNTVFYDYWFANNNPVFTENLMKFCKLLFGTYVIFGPNMAMTKEVWNKIKNETSKNPKAVHEDIDMALHIKKYGKIKYDPSLFTKISARRLKENPFSFFIEYPIRLMKMYFNQK